MPCIDLTNLHLADIEEQTAYEPLDWENNLLAYQIDPGHVVVLSKDCSMITVKMSVERIIEQFAKKNLLLAALNMASHRAAGEKYSGIVHGRYRLIPSAGFDRTEKHWIMAHHLVDIHEHDKTGVVTLVFKVKKKSIRVLIDANLTSLQKRLQSAENVSCYQMRVFKALKRSLGFSKKKPDPNLIGHDLEELRNLIRAWGVEIVSSYVITRFSTALAKSEEKLCQILTCKVVTGRSESKERRRWFNRKKK